MKYPWFAMAALSLVSSAAMAQDYSVVGGSVSVNEDGSFTGTTRDVNSTPGLPDEVDETNFSGQVGPDGSITATYTGTDTYNAVSGGSVTSVSDTYSGTFTGTISDDGTYSGRWSGDGGTSSGTVSGVVAGYGTTGSTPGTDAGGTTGTGTEGTSTESTPSIGGTPSPETGQSGDISTHSEPNGGRDAIGTAPSSAAVSIGQITNSIESASILCNQTGAYAIDCLAERYEQIARNLGNSRRNAVPRQAIEGAARDLRRIARQNQDRNKPRARIRTADNSVRSKRNLVPVAAARRAQASQQAIAAISEAQTQLLRSGNSTDRQAFTQVAEAMNSGKVLLRSG